MVDPYDLLLVPDSITGTKTVNHYRLTIRDADKVYLVYIPDATMAVLVGDWNIQKGAFNGYKETKEDS